MSTTTINAPFSSQTLEALKAKARLDAGFYNLIDGRRVSHSKTLPVYEPSTGQEIAQVPDVDRKMLDEAVAAARRAFPAWSAMPMLSRRTLMLRALEVIEEHLEELRVLLVRETGRTGAISDWELNLSLQGYRTVLQTLSLEAESFDVPGMGHVTKSHVPLGVVCGISPWNFPVILSICKIIPALYTGNTIVLKPSPFTPLTMLRIADYLRGVLPNGVLNIITGGDDLGPWMTSHPGFDKVAFTGSTPTGKRVFAAAANDFKRLTLELGGNDVGIVLPDADVEKIAEALFGCLFVANGQICIGLKRLLVPENLYSALTEKLVQIAEKAKRGDGLDPEVVVGPTQNKVQLQRLEATWKDIEQSGVKVLFRGSIPKDTGGYFFPVTILGNPPADAEFVMKENFGPIRSVLKYKDIEEAIRIGNSTEYGLGASVWGENQEQLEAVAKRLQAGTIWINQHSLIDPTVPFTGHKHSGFGIEFGREGLEDYCNVQVISRKA